MAIPILGILVVSYVWDPIAQQFNPIDATTTGAQGSFAIQVPTSPGANDQIVFFALHIIPGTSNVDYAVVLPGVGDGMQQLASVSAAPSTFWQWAAADTTLGASGGTLTITEAMFSGAVRVFDWLRYAFESAESIQGTPGKPLVVWIRPNTSWSCGSCALPVPITLGSFPFGAQIFFPALAQDQGYYADPVTTHEYGHWVMASWGTFPDEGGPHRVPCVTYPGQAWAEGWATYFSALTRTDGLYYDSQGGTFFWFNIANRAYSNSLPWQRPSANAGLLQMLDENEVAAMLWSMSSQTTPAIGQAANAAFFAALQSPLVNRAAGQYSRGYTRHVWDLGVGCNKTDVVDTGQSTVEFADYLDALACRSFSTNTINAATNPATNYPYPANAPICQ